MGTYYIPSTRGHGITPTNITGPDGIGDITINRFTPQQTMDGFGACDRNCITMTDADADFFFGTGTGQLGLTILRTTMYSDGSGSAGFPTNLTKAAARGAIIWMAPWTAPAAWKDNGDLNNGGHLLVGHYDDWATRMAGFQATCQSSASVNLYGISVQGEPNFVATYNSMIYTNAEMVNFVKVLGPKLAALSPVPHLILPEVSDATLMAGYVNAMLADGTAAAYLDIVAWHQYAGNNATPVANYRNWMSEMSYFNAFDPTMTNALTMVGDIHAALTVANVTAWHWWELEGGNQSDNENLVGYNGAPTQTTKRSYALGNFAKFIRPGYVRVSTTGTVSGVSVTAFVSGTSYVIVAINTGSAATLTFGLPRRLTTMTPYLTDATHDLAAQTGVAVVAGVLSTTLAASSVTTFAGTST
jgi:glucuronoarabinoxylan endo-1,4-beta-xylanase